ncbi:MAG: hypothetical protein ACR2QF_06840, partial [Geminicoccaceae bacterium]
DMEGIESTPTANGATPDVSKPAPQSGRRRPNKKATGRKMGDIDGSTAVDPEEDADIGQRFVVPNAPPKEQISKSRGSGKTRRRLPSDNLKPGKMSKKAMDAGTPKAGKLDIELTPDGFVKWWK